MPYQAGTAFVAVRPSTRGFHSQLRQELRAINPVLDVRVRPVLDRSDLRFPPIPDQTFRVRAAVDGDSLSRSLIQVAALGRAMAQLALPVAVVAAVPSVASLGAAAVATAGSLYLLPAAGAAAAVGIATFAVGLAHVADALGPTGTAAQVKKVNEALAALSPAARETVGVLRSLGPAWSDLRLDVQERLFDGVARQVQSLAGLYLPLLQDVLSRVAFSFNYAAQAVARFMANPSTVADFSTGLSSVENALENLSGAFLPLTKAFTDIFVVGASFLPGFATSLSGLASQFAAFISDARGTGELATMIRDGVTAIGQLGSVLGSTGSILNTVFQAGISSGADMLGTTQRLTGELDRFLSTGVGNAALVTLFKTINQVIDSLLPGLLAVGDAIALGVIALGPSLAPLADSFSLIAISVAPLITDLAVLTSVILPPLAGLLATIAPLMGPITAGLLAMLVVRRVVAGYAALSAALTAYAIAQGGSTAAAFIGTGAFAGLRAAVLSLNFALLANPFTLIVTALVGLAAALVFAYNHSETFRNIVNGAFTAVMGVVRTVVDFFAGPFKDGVVGAVTAVIDFFRNFPQNVSAILSTLGGAIASAAAAAWNWLLTTAQDTGVAVVAFVTGLPRQIAYALGFLVGTLGRLGIDAWAAFQVALVNAVTGTIVFFTELPGRLVAGLVGLGAALSNAATTGGTAFLTSIIIAFNAVVTFFAELPGRIVSTLVNLGAALSTSARDAGTGFVTAVVLAINGVFTFFQELPARILGFFAGAGAWLSQAGTDTLQGFIGGLVGGAIAVRDFFTGLVESFLQGFRDALGIASPSTVFAQFGADILTGLLNGLIAFGQMVLGWITSFGQMIVSGFTTAVGFLQGIWSNFWTGLQVVSDAVFSAIRAAIELVWFVIRGLFAAAQAALTGNWDAFWGTLRVVAATVFAVIRGGIDTAWAAVRSVFGGAIDFLTGLWSTWWTSLRDTALVIFTAIRNMIDVAWAAVRRGFQLAVDFLSLLWSNWWNGMRIIGETVFNGIRTAIDVVWSLITGAFRAAVDTVSTMWGAFWDGLASVASTVFNTIKGAIDTVINGIVGAFRFVVDQVGIIWNGIRELLAGPIRFMVNTVFNNGIVPAWNFVAGLLPGIDPIKGITLAFADGGIVPGAATPGRDTTVARVGGQEAIMRPEWTQAVGPGFIAQANAAARTGGVSGAREFMADPRYQGATERGLRSGRLVEGADHNGPGTLTQGFGGVRRHVAQAGHFLRRKFGVSSVGGIGSRPGPSDHPRGLALDFMTYGDTAKGDRLSKYVVDNAAHLAIKYIIWKQRINQGGGWKGMPDRGSITANHYDHPHVSFLDGPGGGKNFSNGGAGGLFGFLNPIPGMIRGFFETVTNPLVDAIPGGPPRWFDIPKNMARFSRDKVLDFLLGSAGPEEMGGGGGMAGVGAVQDQVRAVANRYGWGTGPQWAALARLVQKESSWNPNAQNPTSTAFGLFQFLNSTWGTVGATKTSNPGLQAEAGLRYIQGRYRNPAAALAFHNRNNYYDDGGVARGRGYMLKNVIEPERVLSNRQNIGFERLVEMATSSSGARLMAGLTEEQTSGGNRGGDVPLIGSLTVPAPSTSAAEVIDEVFTHARHARHQSRYRR